jgi:hypothetical protein
MSDKSIFLSRLGEYCKVQPELAGQRAANILLFEEKASVESEQLSAPRSAILLSI